MAETLPCKRIHRKQSLLAETLEIENFGGTQSQAKVEIQIHRLLHSRQAPRMCCRFCAVLGAQEYEPSNRLEIRNATAHDCIAIKIMSK